MIYALLGSTPASGMRTGISIIMTTSHMAAMRAIKYRIKLKNMNENRLAVLAYLRQREIQLEEFHCRASPGVNTYLKNMD